jgi:hypothetical protein
VKKDDQHGLLIEPVNRYRALIEVAAAIERKAA